MRVIGAQFRISQEDFSGSNFWRHVENFYRKTEPGDVIVFPEDLGLITAFHDIACHSLPEAMSGITERKSGEIAELSKRFPDVDPTAMIFLALTDSFVDSFYNLSSSLSRKYSVYTVTCNNMADFGKNGDRVEIRDPRIYNTAFVFGTKGELAFAQRKVFLTDMERALSFSGGNLDQVKPFVIDGVRFGIAISLDAFEPEYVARLSGCDVILQPDANPGKWNSYLENGRWQPEEWMESAHYISQRLNSAPFTVNPMMVGPLFEMNFEGQSSITKRAEVQDERMGYVGNLPQTGFSCITRVDGYDPHEFVRREEIEARTLDYPEEVIVLEKLKTERRA